MQQETLTFKGLPGLWSQFKASLGNLGKLEGWEIALQ